MEWDSARILATLPHRYPFLLIDRVLEVDPGRRAAGYKNVSHNEWFFQGHFPGRPVMPGVLIVEALAQMAAIAALGGEGKEGQIPFFAGIDACRFRRPVVPGDVLMLEAELTHARARAGKGHGRATVDGQVVAEVDMLFALAPATAIESAR
jgi:3-hydroxyacyl-[acyl-carrier-protein] dehydratase